MHNHCLTWQIQFHSVIADYERENPVFKEAVKIAITPMILSLSILNHVEMNSDQEVLGYEIGLILLNVGMYVGMPAITSINISACSSRLIRDNST